MSKLREFGDKIIARVDAFIDEYEVETARRQAVKNEPSQDYRNGWEEGTEAAIENARLAVHKAYQLGSDEGYRDGYAMGVADTEIKNGAEPEAASDRGDFTADEEGSAVTDWTVRAGESLPEMLGRIADGLRGRGIDPR